MHALSMDVSLLLPVGTTGGMRRNPGFSRRQELNTICMGANRALLTAYVCRLQSMHAPCLQVWKVEDGSSNKREILKLTFPEAITPYFL